MSARRSDQCFKHVLIPIDGSPASNRAANAGIAFAGRFGAKVTAYYALEALDPVWNEGYRLDKTAIEGFEVGARKAAQRRLDALGRTAKLAGVPYASAVTKGASASEGKGTRSLQNPGSDLPLAFNRQLMNRAITVKRTTVQADLARAASGRATVS